MSSAPDTHTLRQALASVRRAAGQLRRAERLDDNGNYYLRAQLVRELEELRAHVTTLRREVKSE